MLASIKIALQYLLPKLWLTQLAGLGAEWQGGKITHCVIALFKRAYKVNMQEAQKPNVDDYPTFNAFFTRPLRDDARPIDIDPSVLVMPADGIISQMGHINEKQMFQAKKHQYNLETLLAGNASMSNYFRNGCFATTYLAPRDYHRIHMPCNGVLQKVIYVPGELFSVNPLTTTNIPNVFTRNERLICLFKTTFGPIAQILIGATIVGSIETVWSGTVTPPRKGIIKCWNYPQANSANAVVLLKGQEMGRFKLGSTVINLFTGDNVFLCMHLHPHYISRVGQPLAHGIAQSDNTLP
ncbi:MAG: phosphatidylserine decarboxylase proenzyme [Sodalis sp. Fse]|nr:MAG: phosphatidylserine decarboxylase proenzyme [Sodalis sp. Fle]UVK78076.1 MAG: phosphatidylserine decarboxylase proenzyme [Sodalis sp. Fse]